MNFAGPRNTRARATRLFLWCATAMTASTWTCVAKPSAFESAAPKAAHPALYTREDGVVYTSGAHGELRADMYLPVRPGRHAAVIFLHGGAWKHGDRSQMQPVASALAEHGYVGMAIDYDTTAQGDRFPLALGEAERAVRWLREHSARFHVDPAQIAVAGSSAGGELAALVALDRKAIAGSEVQAAIVFNGVLDLSYTGPDAEDMVAPYLGGSCTDKPAECAAASPAKQVHAGAPPFFVGHGTADRIVPYTQAVTFVKELRAAHVSVRAFVAEGAGHTYWDSDQWRSANLAAVLQFLDAHLPGGRT